MNEHYVYVYVDPRNGNVFYVGCGKGRRMWVHLRPSVLAKDDNKSRVIKEILSVGLHPMIVVVNGGLTQSDALNREREWIRFYGKSNLTNLTTGGQGCPGVQSFLGKHHTKEARERIRQSKIGERNPMFGKTRTAEALKKFSEKMSGENHPMWGKHHSKAVVEKISSKLKGFQWSDKECVKRSVGMQRVWKQRRESGTGIPKHKKIMVQCGSEIRSVDEWAVRTGIPKATIVARLKRGWETRKALGI